VIFKAPAYVGPGTYDTYMLYNRDYTRDDNASDYGGQTTEVHVYPGTTPANTWPAQTIPNT
jgi:hypothetical protein